MADEELVRKLGLKPGQRICVLEGPQQSRQTLIDAMPDAVFLDESLMEGELYEMIFFWPQSLVGLGKRFDALQRRIQPAGAIWAVMPKMKFASMRGIDFSWEQLQRAGLTTDLVDNKTASINDQDYATRFVIRKDRRSAGNGR